jgi:hypothetical protein
LSTALMASSFVIKSITRESIARVIRENLEGSYR